MRNCFVGEEDEGLILASGVTAAWLTGKAGITFGPLPHPLARSLLSLNHKTAAEKM